MKSKKVLRLLCWFSALSAFFLFSGCQEKSINLHWGPTQELNIELQTDAWNSSAMYVQLNQAIALYQEQYPEVQVHITEVPCGYGDPYFKQLGTRIMAGEGPDVLFFNNLFTTENDILKMEKAGAFEDLAQAVQDDLNPKDYVQPIFEDSVYDGHQYLIPISYSLPLFITTEEAASAVNLDFDRAQNTLEILTELGDCKEKNPEVYLFSYPRFMLQTIHMSGMEYGDVQSGEITLDFELFHQLLDQWKRIDPYSISEEDIRQIGQPQMNVLPIYKAIKEGRFTCSLGLYGYRDYFYTTQWFLQDTVPQFFPWRNMDGGITAMQDSALAIRRNAPNAQNAWNFIKVALSAEAQAAPIQDPISTGYLPVNRSAWKIAYQEIYSNEIAYGNDTTSVGVQAVPKERYNEFVKLQDEITGVSIRFPADREIFELFTPYLEGTATFEECQQKAEDFLFIYLSE
jgi:ABC-type glycerol-3-phosphate transport system substrate-binding protein